MAVAAGSGTVVPACGVGESLDTTRMTKKKSCVSFFSTCSENFKVKETSLKSFSSSPCRRTPAAGGRERGSGVGWSAVREQGGWQEGSGDWRPETGVLPAAPHRSLSSVTAAGENIPSYNEHMRLHDVIY